MELHPHRHEYRMIIMSLFIALALISLALVLYYQRNGMVREPSAVNTQMPTRPLTSIPVNRQQKVVVTPGNIKYTFFSVVPAKVGVSEYKQDEQVAIQIIGSTKDKVVMGYDVLLTGGGNAYDVVSVKSLLPEFTVLKFVKDDHLTITGILKPSAKEQKSYNNVPMVEIVVIPKQTGILNLQVLSEQGKESSKVMTTGSLGNSEKLITSDSDNLRLDIKQ